MGDLGSAHFRRALDVAGGLADLRDLSEFPSRSAQLLRTLIPCDHSGHNAIDTHTGCATVVADPIDCVFQGGPEALARFGQENPLLVRAQRGDMAAMRLSNHISRRDLHRTDLYQHVYRLVGLEYQLVMQLPVLLGGLRRQQQVTGVSLSRSTRDFADTDLLLLELMKPFFVATLERLHEMALLKATASVEDDCDRLVILVDGNDRVAWATKEAQVSLEVSECDLLPVGLRGWVTIERRRQRSGGSPIMKPLDGEPMQGRLLLDAYPGLDAIHLARDVSSAEPGELLRLGLTRRQAEVLTLVVQGQTSAEIASHLFVSRRTVEKHLDGIFRRLGVRNRSQAVLVAIRAQMNAKCMN